MSAAETTRRQFLSASVAFATVAVAPNVFLMTRSANAAVRAPGEAAKPTQRWGMLIDLNKNPDGWDFMVKACREENGWDSHHNRPATDAQWIREVTVRDPKSGAESKVPVMCQHCEQPPCVDVCPTGASMRRDDGIVLVDKHTCIGCRYCMMACPYAARSFIHEEVEAQKPHAPRGKGTVESCTMCVHRVDAGRLPACVEADGGRAILFGDLNDPSSAISKEVSKYVTTRLRADLGAEPGVHYRGF